MKRRDEKRYTGTQLKRNMGWTEECEPGVESILAGGYIILWALNREKEKMEEAGGAKTANYELANTPQPAGEVAKVVCLRPHTSNTPNPIPTRNTEKQRRLKKRKEQENKQTMGPEHDFCLFCVIICCPRSGSTSDMRQRDRTRASVLWKSRRHICQRNGLWTSAR